MARPEGKRVLVISAKGETIARQMSGAITHRYYCSTRIRFTQQSVVHIMIPRWLRGKEPRTTYNASGPK